MTVETVISGGDLVFPDGVTYGSIAFDDRKIVALGADSQMPAADRTVDASGNLVMPGFVDPHVHIDPESPSRIDDYKSASKAAAAGGVTTFIDFAWQDRFRGTDPGIIGGIDHKRRQGNSEAHVDFSLHCGITKEDLSVTEKLPEAIESGVISFKFFKSTYETGVSNGFIDRMVQAIAELDAVAMFHAEDPSVCEFRCREYIEDGKHDPTWFPKSRPDYAEAMALDDLLRMTTEAGAKYYGVHTSSGKGADVIDRYREDGSAVRAETCTQYTVIDDSIYEEWGNLAKFAPPPRKPEDNEALFDHLRRGTLSIVSTDHANYRRESKESVEWWESPFGIGGLQTSVPLFHNAAVVEREFSYPTLVRLMSTNPAQTFGLEEKGTLGIGTDADVVIFDPNEEYTIRTKDDLSKSDFCIYDGMEVTGRVQRTFVRGTEVYDGEEIVSDPGHGEFVERSIPDWNP